jgi:sulfhydrogenase subunit alpha
MKEIELNHICKVEGHASLDLKIEKGIVKSCELEAEEGARFFEALTIGKKLEDIQEVVSRICGICSSAHSVAAIYALENAIGVKATEQEKIVRDLLLIGERLRSHATHLYFLTYPDYLGVGALTMAKNEKDKISDALKLIRAGNRVVEVFGGREMHPFVKFHSKLPDFSLLKGEISALREAAERTIKLFTSLKYPDFERESEYLCLWKENEYSSSLGWIKSHSEKIKENDYQKHLKENIKEYATSKFVLHEGFPYLTGSLVRLNINHDKLDETTKNYIKKYKIKLPMHNPFLNNIAQAVEISFCIEKILADIERLEKLKPENKPNKVNVKAGVGIAAVEAPRGTLFHEYHTDNDGKITYCNIITPTAQNLNQMEIDIKNYVNKILREKLSKDKITMEIEKLIRSYDPCFSCSTHFLKVNWKGEQIEQL